MSVPSDLVSKRTRTLWVKTETELKAWVKTEMLGSTLQDTFTPVDVTSSRFSPQGSKSCREQHPQSQKADAGHKPFLICGGILGEHKGRCIRMGTSCNGTTHRDELKVKQYDAKYMQTQLSPYVISPVEASLLQLLWNCTSKLPFVLS